MRDRVELLETGIRQAGGDNGALRSTLASAQVALMQMEARRSARELIVSHVEGEVMALRSALGEYLPAGASVAQIRDTESRSLHAVLRIEPDMAKRIKSGMPASIEVMAPDGTSHWVDGGSHFGDSWAPAALAGGASARSCGLHVPGRCRLPPGIKSLRTGWCLVSCPCRAGQTFVCRAFRIRAALRVFVRLES